jgi:hypothetical protein
MKDVGIFDGHLAIFCGFLVYCMVIWYIFPASVSFSKIKLATLGSSLPRKNGKCWSISRPFGICYGNLVHFVAVLYTFPTFGILHNREKSGSPVTHSRVDSFIYLEIRYVFNAP